jgi:hypothetical protein
MKKTALIKSNCLALLLALISLSGAAQTTIINPANATGTSGADGSFESASPAGWTIVNGATNKWFMGTQSFCSGTRGAYVSSHATGGNNNYTNTTSDISHFYKDVTFPAGQTCIVLSFSWKAAGESTYDGIKVFFGSTAVTPVANTAFTTSDPTATQVGNTWYNQNTTCNTVTITLPASYAGTTKRLVFSWQNDNSVGTNPAGTIDAVSLIAQNATTPSCATALVPANAATAVSTCTPLTWTAPASSGCNTATSYDVYFGTTPTPPFVTNVTTTSYQPAMNFSTTYYWQIIPRNAAGPAVGCAIQSFTTAAATNPQYNLVDDATSASPYNCVTLTPNTTSQRGCAWDANSTMNFLADFSYDIDVNLGNNDAGADGMAFVLQNDPLARCKCGTVGGALGAGGILNSVTVEIDTYLNFEDRDDFTAPFIGCSGTEDPDHLDIWYNGNINPSLDGNCDAVAAGERPANPFAVRLQSAPGVNYNIENGLTHKFRISWTAATNTLSASVWNSTLTLNYGTVSASFNPITVFGTNTPYFGFTASTGGFSNTQTFCLPAILLPVELISFDADCIDGKAELHWKTQSERENDHFTIEKSCDGINYATIQSIPSKGDAVTVQNYQMIDNSDCHGVTYYKLSQTDKNGTVEVLGIRSVQPCSEFQEVYVYPNPAKDQINVSWTNLSMQRLTITNSLGQNLMNSLVSDKSMTETAFDISQLANGVYYILVEQDFGSKTYKFVVER